MASVGSSLRRLLPLALVVAFACGKTADAPEKVETEHAAPSARELLERAREATAAVRSVEYDFEFASEGSPIGWATGHTWMQQRTDLADSLMRVEGTVQLGPDEPKDRFAFATDGQQAWQRVDDAERVEVARAQAGGRSLGGLAVYGYLPEFVEQAPFWKELRSADALRRLEPRAVGGVTCHVVEALWKEPATGGETRYRWYLGQDDLLPRGMHWRDPSTPPEGYDFLLSNLRVTQAEPMEHFRLEVPSGFALDEAPATVALGELSPEWELRNARGETVRLSDLRGRVVVLDFWNTWCFICRNLQPGMASIHRDYADAPVTVLGLNVFEIGDPAEYWRQIAPGYDYLLDADAVAQLYDVPWQPAVVVIDRSGRVSLSLLGGTADRAEQVRSAIEAGLAK